MELLTKAAYSDAVSQREMDNRQVAYEAACEGIVLLKNKGVLPLREKKLALYGSGASRTIKGGTGSGEVNERRCVTVLEGLEKRGFAVTSSRWLADFEEEYAAALASYKLEKKKSVNFLKISSIMDMLTENFRIPSGRAITEEDVASSDTDQCVYILSRQAGEGGDRRLEPGDYCLTDREKQDIAFCAARYKNFVLIINCGSSMEMSFLQELPEIPAILYMCQLGMEGGYAVADVLSGAVTPSGKLADTWAKTYDDVPFARDYSYLNGNVQEEYYKEGIYVGYRYFDSFRVEPAFAFGFGLSYTDFSIRSAGAAIAGQRVTVQAMVTNTGREFSGKEVVQLYVSAPAGKLHKEYQSLAAFEKTDLLAPGQRQTLSLQFDLADMASYREEDASFVLEAGEYILRLGNSSRNTVAVGVVLVEQEVIVSRHRNICPCREPMEELASAQDRGTEQTAGLPCLILEEGAIATLVHSYEQPLACADAKVQAFLNTLSVREMVEIVVGKGMVTGEARFNLPGSVGNTTSKFWGRGLANVALCDGPAGLRIQKVSTVSKGGKVKPVEMALSVFEALPGFVKNRVLGDVEKQTPLYQFATAFPVAAALAQSWNTRLLEQVGRAVFREMEEYGCTYWLAPAVNIHRNPLCGRNFEYFSEDPLLTGRLAAAITRGVQQKPGYYVTVKHFAANNQEDNRMHVSSNLSERALREIYLKGFAITVAAGAKGIMTSYNRLNGVYTPNSYDLCTNVLRCEWGFDGVVMTDWYSTKGNQGNNALCMSSGNDLIMPGGEIFKAQILAGLRKGLITREDIRRCCSNVVKAIFDSATQKEYIK